MSCVTRGTIYHFRTDWNDIKFSTPHSDVVIVSWPRLFPNISPEHFLIGQPLLIVSELHRFWRQPKNCKRLEVTSTILLVFLATIVRWILVFITGTIHGLDLKDYDMFINKDNQSSTMAWRLGRVMNIIPETFCIVRQARWSQWIM